MYLQISVGRHLSTTTTEKEHRGLAYLLCYARPAADQHPVLPDSGGTIAAQHRSILNYISRLTGVLLITHLPTSTHRSFFVFPRKQRKRYDLGAGDCDLIHRYSNQGCPLHETSALQPVCVAPKPCFVIWSQDPLWTPILVIAAVAQPEVQPHAYISSICCVRLKKVRLT